MKMLVSSRGIARSCDIYPESIISDDFNFDPRPYRNIKFRDAIYVVTSQLHGFVNTILPNLISPFVLVTGASVLGAPQEVCEQTQIDMHKLLSDDRLIHWFCQNNDWQHDKVSAIPLGLDFHTLATANHWWGPQQSPLRQNQQLHRIHKQIPAPENRPPIAYATFHFMPDIRLENDRNNAIAALQDKSFVHFAPHHQPREDLWFAHQNFRYIVSPLGQGIDCHRTWEALALGSIPIVRRKPINTMFRSLPVIEVDSWQELNPEFLHAQWLLNKNKRDRSPLYLSYWMKTIREAQKA